MPRWIWTEEEGEAQPENTGDDPRASVILNNVINSYYSDKEQIYKKLK